MLQRRLEGLFLSQMHNHYFSLKDKPILPQLMFSRKGLKLHSNLLICKKGFTFAKSKRSKINVNQYTRPTKTSKRGRTTSC